MIRTMIAVVGFVDRLNERIGKSLAWFMPLMVAVIVVEVVARYFFAAPTAWAYDSALLVFAWVGFVGGAFAMKRNAHIRVDILSSRLGPQGQAVLELIGVTLALFFVLLVLWQVGMAAADAWQFGSRRPTDWAPPLVLFLAAVPIGAALLILQLLSSLLRAVMTLLDVGDAHEH